MYHIRMSWLNYHHLLYFWTVAREGSIAKACERLLLSQPTISGQIRELEKAFGAKLFDKVGRNLVLTEAGREAYRYADEIFALGQELKATMQGGSIERAVRLHVGIHDSIPKLISSKILAPIMAQQQQIQIVCHEGSPEQLLARLALHEMVAILLDSPASPTVKVRAFNHLLGECGVSFCAAPKLAATYKRKFPHSLNGAPFLLPLQNTSLRRSLEHWLEATGIRLNVRGEFADTALLKAFAQEGVGVFIVPTAIEAEICRQYRVKVIGRVDAIRERIYLISAERKLRQPVIAALAELARTKLFGKSGDSTSTSVP
jgi:LysR family transcriptional activator of nhaA